MLRLHSAASADKEWRQRSLQGSQKQAYHAGFRGGGLCSCSPGMHSGSWLRGEGDGSTLVLTGQVRDSGCVDLRPSKARLSTRNEMCAVKGLSCFGCWGPQSSRVDTSGLSWSSRGHFLSFFSSYVSGQQCLKWAGDRANGAPVLEAEASGAGR